MNLKWTWLLSCEDWNWPKVIFERFQHLSINQFIIALIQPLVYFRFCRKLWTSSTSINLLSSFIPRFSTSNMAHTSRSQTCHQSTVWWEGKVDKLRDSSHLPFFVLVVTLHPPTYLKWKDEKIKSRFYRVNEQEWNTGMTQFITLNWWMFIVLENFFYHFHPKFRWRLKGIFTSRTFLSINDFHPDLRVLLMNKSSSYFLTTTKQIICSSRRRNFFDCCRMFNTFITFIKYLWSKSCEP